ncbi:hypothetical protein GCM10027172_12210 [Halomonas garicola]
MRFKEEELAAVTTTATIDKLHGEAGHLSSLCQADLLTGSQRPRRVNGDSRSRSVTGGWISLASACSRRRSSI